MHHVRLFALLPLIACGMSPAKFQKQYAEGVCDYYAECEPDYLEYYGGDAGDCVEEFEDYYDADDYDECDFDKKQAKECIAALRDISKSCDIYDFDYDACDEIWDCSG